ncbi:MAG: hypothetical protein E7Z80_04605 [Methanobrevibacter thaueri]|nr:hypothetical protein [Methanobrevibacter thaueri]
MIFRKKHILFLIFIIILISIINTAYALENQTTINTTTTDTLNQNIQTISMDKVTKRYNQAIEYKATFYDFSGNPLKNASVLFNVDDKDYYQVNTDSNGVALLTILIKNGNHNISALNPTTLNVSYDTFKVFDVLSGNKNIRMYCGDSNTYDVRVFDDNGNPQKAGETVTFYFNKQKYNVKTDSKGYAKLKINIKPGYYAVSAVYGNFIVLNSVLVKPVLKQLTHFNSRPAHSTFKYKVKLLSKNNKNKKIKTKFNKKTYTSKTNKKGVAVFKCKSPKKTGKYKLISTYKKDKLVATFVRYRTR